MAISIDRVYRTCLSIANKEQRGFMTPDNIAKAGMQVELSIMEDNLVEYRNLIRQRDSHIHASNYGNLVSLYKEKIDAFLTTSTLSPSSSIITTPSDAYKILGVYSTDRQTKFEEVDRSELNSILSSPLTSPSSDFPVYYKNNTNTDFTLNPTTVTDVSVDYLKFPSTPRWGYFRNEANGVFTYDPNPYIATGLVKKTAAFTTFTTNITGGIDNEYVDVDATRSDVAGTIPLTVVVSGGVVTQVNVTNSGTGFSAGVVLTVSASDLGVAGPSSDLTITLQSTDIYNGSTAGSTDFELHPSDEVRLVTDLLAYFGITVRDVQLSQIAGNISQVKELTKQT